MNKLELGIFAGLGLAGVLIFIVWRLGDEVLRQLAFLLVGGILVIGMMLAGAVMIRAGKKKDQTGEKHFYHDGTRTVVRERVLDGRAQGDVRLLQMPQVSSQAVFPEMLSAAYRSGLLAQNSTTTAAQTGGETVEGEVLREWEPGEWTGEIR